MSTDDRTVEGSRAAAEHQAQEIRRYWFKQGYDVEPTLVLLDAGGDRSHWTVQLPGFVNGCPPRTAKISAQP